MTDNTSSDTHTFYVSYETSDGKPRFHQEDLKRDAEKFFQGLKSIADVASATLCAEPLMTVDLDPEAEKAEFARIARETVTLATWTRAAH